MEANFAGVKPYYALQRAHKAEVEQIALHVQEYYNSKQRFRIYHGSSSSTRRPVDHASNVIDTSRLDKVLLVNTNTKIAVVESNVPMDTLLEETLIHGMTPLVMTEFPGITVGGAYSGTAGESSSFKHQFFDRTISEIEMILANGEVVRCSENENADVFKGAPGALGTLGVVTLLHVRLQRAARYVEVTYHPFSSTDEAIEKFEAFATSDDDIIEYLDGIMFSKNKGAIITGRRTDTNPNNHKIQRFIRAYDPWYFMHVEACITSNAPIPHTELIPLPDYIFRYNRGCFWCGKTIFDSTGLRFSSFTRKVMDPLLRTRMLYKCLHAQEPSTRMTIQDVALPLPAVKQFVAWAAERLDIWPLWLCPLRVSPMPTLHPHPLKPGTLENKTSELMLNIGLYGGNARSYEEWISENRDLEDEVFHLGGMKWAYAAQLYPEDKFWAQYDREWYESLREKYHATSLPDIYDKTKVDFEAGRAIVATKLAKREKSWMKNFGYVSEMKDSMSCVWQALKSRAWKLEKHSVWKDWPDHD